jgi:hypothetical protein
VNKEYNTHLPAEIIAMSVAISIGAFAKLEAGSLVSRQSSSALSRDGNKGDGWPL